MGVKVCHYDAGYTAADTVPFPLDGRAGDRRTRQPGVGARLVGPGKSCRCIGHSSVGRRHLRRASNGPRCFGIRARGSRDALGDSAARSACARPRQTAGLVVESLRPGLLGLGNAAEPAPLAVSPVSLDARASGGLARTGAALLAAQRSTSASAGICRAGSWSGLCLLAAGDTPQLASSVPGTVAPVSAGHALSSAGWCAALPGGPGRHPAATRAGGAPPPPR